MLRGFSLGGDDAPWRRMLPGFSRGGDDDYFGGGCSRALARVVTTIAGRTMLHGLGTARGGEDDCVGGRTTLVGQPIAREEASASDYKQWRRSLRRRLGVGLGGV